jgi:hypothetical protein
MVIAHSEALHAMLTADDQCWKSSRFKFYSRADSNKVQTLNYLYHLLQHSILLG